MKIAYYFRKITNISIHQYLQFILNKTIFKCILMTISTEKEKKNMKSFNHLLNYIVDTVLYFYLINANYSDICTTIYYILTPCQDVV